MADEITPEEHVKRLSDLMDKLLAKVREQHERNEDLVNLLSDACEAICEQQIELTRHRLGSQFTKKYAGLAARISFQLNGGQLLAADGEAPQPN